MPNDSLALTPNVCHSQIWVGQTMYQLSSVDSQTYMLVSMIPPQLDKLNLDNQIDSDTVDETLHARERERESWI